MAPKKNTLTNKLSKFFIKKRPGQEGFNLASEVQNLHDRLSHAKLNNNGIITDQVSSQEIVKYLQNIYRSLANPKEKITILLQGNPSLKKLAAIPNNNVTHYYLAIILQCAPHITMNEVLNLLGEFKTIPDGLEFLPNFNLSQGQFVPTLLSILQVMIYKHGKSVKPTLLNPILSAYYPKIKSLGNDHYKSLLTLGQITCDNELTTQWFSRLLNFFSRLSLREYQNSITFNLLAAHEGEALPEAPCLKMVIEMTIDKNQPDFFGILYPFIFACLAAGYPTSLLIKTISQYHSDDAAYLAKQLEQRSICSPEEMQSTQRTPLLPEIIYTGNRYDLVIIRDFFYENGVDTNKTLEMFCSNAVINALRLTENPDILMDYVDILDYISGMPKTAEQQLLFFQCLVEVWNIADLHCKKTQLQTLSLVHPILSMRHLPHLLINSLPKKHMPQCQDSISKLQFESMPNSYLGMQMSLIFTLAHTLQERGYDVSNLATVLLELPDYQDDPECTAWLSKPKTAPTPAPFITPESVAIASSSTAQANTADLEQLLLESQEQNSELDALLQVVAAVEESNPTGTQSTTIQNIKNMSLALRKGLNTNSKFRQKAIAELDELAAASAVVATAQPPADLQQANERPN